MTTTREALSACIGRIDDPQVREFARSAFAMLCPEDHWFWRASASSSGMRHPPACRGVCGLVRHTLLASAWLEELLRVFPEAHADAARLAVLLHDTRKYATRDAMPVHGQLASDAILQLLDVYSPPGGELSTVARTTIEIAANCVKTHMGQWSSTPTQQVVHLADYCASRDIDTEALRELEDAT